MLIWTTSLVVSIVMSVILSRVATALVIPVGK